MDLPIWLRTVIETYGYWGILLAVAVESTGIPFPGETALVAGAVYAGTMHSLNIGLVIAAAAGGAILGDNVGYELGHRGGFPLLKRLARLLHIDDRGLAGAERYFERHGDKTVFLGRFIAILRTWVAFLAGINHMPRGKFFVWNAAGGIVWATIYGVLGYTLGNNVPLLQRTLKDVGYAGIAIFVLVVLALAGLWFFRRRRRRPTEADTSERPPRDAAMIADHTTKALSSTTQRTGSLIVGLAAEQAEARDAAKRRHTPPPEQPPRDAPPAPAP